MALWFFSILICYALALKMSCLSFVTVIEFSLGKIKHVSSQLILAISYVIGYFHVYVFRQSSILRENLMMSIYSWSSYCKRNVTCLCPLQHWRPVAEVSPCDEIKWILVFLICNKATCEEQLPSTYVIHGTMSPYVIF